MKITIEFNEYEVDSDLDIDLFYMARQKLVEQGYKLYYEPENKEHYWLNRPLTAWEEKDFLPVEGEDLKEFIERRY